MDELEFEAEMIKAIERSGGKADHIEREAFPDLLIMMCGNIILCENKVAKGNENIYSLYQPGQLNYSYRARGYGVHTKTCAMVGDGVYVFRTADLAERYLKRKGEKESVIEALLGLGHLVVKADDINHAAQIIVHGWRM